MMQNLLNGRYCAYIRKSRVDMEAELRGEGETLARHENALKELAIKMHINLCAMYKEIVSGETISSRPVMQQLLSEVEQGKWAGVLVMEVERLARGDTIDQGLVSQCFKYSNTKIITPLKTYDPSNEFDEEYFEFGLFMSRREYKTINRRLQRGREASAREGKFVGSIAPYGYRKVKISNDKGYTLEIIPEDAKVIKMIFKLYTEGAPDENGIHSPLGMQAVARKLNEMHIPPVRHEYWQKETIKDILTNPTYCGKIRWGYRKKVNKTQNGERVTSRPINYNDDCILVKGLHEAIISEETFAKAQKTLSDKPAMPIGYKNELKGSLASLIICEKCGRKMVFRKSYSDNKKDYLVCHAKTCDNVSAPYDLVEERVLASLQTLLYKYELEEQSLNNHSDDYLEDLNETLTRIESNIITNKKQLEKAQELLEKDIYTIEDYTQRAATLKEKISAAQADYEKIKSEASVVSDRNAKRKILIPKIKNILSAYDSLRTPLEKNTMLKEVITKAVYLKTTHGGFRGNSADDFTLKLYPKLE